MSNCSIYLTVGNRDCVSGDVVSGQIVLVVDPMADTRFWKGISLSFEGEERTLMERVETKESKDGKGKTTADFIVKTDEISFNLVKTDYRVKIFEQPPAPGQHKFPFQYQLPSGLPGTFSCIAVESKDRGEIRYSLTAAVRDAMGWKPHVYDSTAILMRPDENSPIRGKPILVDSEKFDIKTNLVFAKGNLNFGWSSDSDVITPGSCLKITITGINHSKIDVKDFSIRLNEKVTFGNRSDSSSVTRTIASAVLLVDDKPEWKAENSDQNLSSSTIAELAVPINDEAIRYSYHGENLRVEHSILIVVETAANRTTNPKASHPIYLVPKGTRAMSEPPQEIATIVSEHHASTRPAASMTDPQPFGETKEEEITLDNL